MMEKTFSEFKGRVAVVTGAAQGIGKVIARQLSEMGACVVALDLRFEHVGFEPLENETGIWAAGLDVCNLSQVKNVFDAIEARFGAVHYVVHAAGVLHLGNVGDISQKDWLRTFNVNTHGAFNICSEAARYMRTRKEGAIVMVGSNASSTPRLGMGAYAASKAAATMMMKCLALEMAEYNVRCNIVAPGSTDTQMQHQLWENDDDEQKVIDGDTSYFRLGIPLQCIAKPQQISHSVIFLLSNLASHITMEVLRVDGGATLGSQ